MGVLSRLLGIVPEEDPPCLKSIFPQQASRNIENGVLPVIRVDKLVLGQKEVCHYVEVAVTIKEKHRYQTVRGGGSFHFSGYSIHHGRSESVPVAEPEYTKGILYITNCRIIFVSKKHGFEKRLGALTAVTPYENGVGLQFGGTSHLLLLPDGRLAKMVLDLII